MTDGPRKAVFTLFPKVEDTFQEGQEKEEQQEKEKIKAEDNAVEMSEDFDGQMHDADENETGNRPEPRCLLFVLFCSISTFVPSHPV